MIRAIPIDNSSSSGEGELDHGDYVDILNPQTISGQKTFSAAPVISSISNTGTLTLPTSTGTLALTSQIPVSYTHLTLPTK
jgi:hypothetical protein